MTLGGSGRAGAIGAGEIAGKRSDRVRNEVALWWRASPVHSEFVNYAAIGIWNRPWQWCRHV